MAKRKKKDAACELIAYRFYGIPSERDAVQEDKTFGCCRYLWNRMLGDHNTLYAEIGHVPNNTPADYKDLDECLFLNEVDSLALANTALNLDAATDTYDLIAIEDLDMSAMKQALRFGKAVSDNGWGMFVSMLTYKAERKGKLLVKVDRWFPSSKTCIACGHIHKELKLSDRTYLCPVCGHAMDRDKQAARNILNEAKRMTGAA